MYLKFLTAFALEACCAAINSPKHHTRLVWTFTKPLDQLFSPTCSRRLVPEKNAVMSTQLFFWLGLTLF